MRKENEIGGLASSEKISLIAVIVGDSPDVPDFPQRIYRPRVDVAALVITRIVHMTRVKLNTGTFDEKLK